MWRKSIGIVKISLPQSGPEPGLHYNSSVVCLLPPPAVSTSPQFCPLVLKGAVELRLADHSLSLSLHLLSLIACEIASCPSEAHLPSLPTLILCLLLQNLLPTSARFYRVIHSEKASRKLLLCTQQFIFRNETW